jgi:hypothetical protein
VQHQHGALALVGGTLLVPYSAHGGDCGNYHGWIVGISVADPTKVITWAAAPDTRGGGIWANAGISSDGTSIYFSTGNAFNTTIWTGGEAVLKMPPTLAFDGQPNNYFLPYNWLGMDMSDLDLGSTAPILLHVAGATPSDLIVTMGKDSDAYVLDRSNLGGMSNPLAVSEQAASSVLMATAGYTTPLGTYVVFSGVGTCPMGPTSGDTAFKITPTSPPRAALAWCAGSNGPFAPAVSMTDAAGSNAVVWQVNSQYYLTAFDGDTGATIFSGGGPANSLPLVERHQTPIIVKGRIFVAASNQIYAYTPN